MLTGGDEYLRSLNCNNNPYYLDSPGDWLNYSWTRGPNEFQQLRPMHDRLPQCGSGAAPTKLVFACG